MKNSTTINCPNCNTEIDVNHILTHQIEEGLKLEFEKKANEQEAELKKQKDDLAIQIANFKLEKENEKERFEEKLKKAQKESENDIRLKIKKQLEAEQKDSLESLQKELSEQSEKVKELNALKANFAKLEREKLGLKETLEAENEIKLNETLTAERERIQKQEKEKSELREKELLKQIGDAKKQAEEMQRKIEQGSMQLQGEVQELAIEEYLSQNFPLDFIDEIKKGANGADCLQIVNTYEVQNCGSIYFESKRTKNFSPAWIEKFKNDIREKKANIGVLVTEVLPNGMERMGYRDGIWICTFEEFKGLVMVLRQSLVQIATAVKNEENKGDKMVMLYDFLTSDEFRHQIEGIVEGFSQMQIDLSKEKISTKNRWKQREKQIEKVINNTVNMYGSIRGIAGSAIKSVKELEIEEHFMIDHED